MSTRKDGFVYRCSAEENIEDEFSNWPPDVSYNWFAYAKTALSSYQKHQGADFLLVGLYPYTCKEIYLSLKSMRLGESGSTSASLQFPKAVMLTMRPLISSSLLSWFAMVVCGTPNSLVAFCWMVMILRSPIAVEFATLASEFPTLCPVTAWVSGHTKMGKYQAVNMVKSG